jgi:hypothetical protein
VRISSESFSPVFSGMEDPDSIKHGLGQKVGENQLIGLQKRDLLVDRAERTIVVSQHVAKGMRYVENIPITPNEWLKPGACTPDL